MFQCESLVVAVAAFIVVVDVHVELVVVACVVQVVLEYLRCSPAGIGSSQMSGSMQFVASSRCH